MATTKMDPFLNLFYVWLLCFQSFLLLAVQQWIRWEAAIFFSSNWLFSTMYGSIEQEPKRTAVGKW